MANPGAGTAMAILVSTMIWGSAMSQSNGTDCTNVIISMSPCLNYIQGGNSTTPPTSGCCTQLQTVVNSQPLCLCQVLNGGGSSLGLTIDQTQALTLPRACGVQTPPASQCNTAASSNGNPGGVGTPGSSSTVSSGSGSTSSISSATGKPSDATSIKITAPLFFFLVFVMSYVSTSS